MVQMRCQLLGLPLKCHINPLTLLSSLPILGEILSSVFFYIEGWDKLIEVKNIVKYENEEVKGVMIKTGSSILRYDVK